MKYLILVCALLLTACANRSDAGFESFVAEAKTAPDEAVTTNILAATAFDQRQLIKTAHLKMQVEDVQAQTKQIRQIVATHKGMVADMDYQSNTYEHRNELTLLVPQQQFDALLEEVASIAVFVNHKRIRTDDVTEAFIDLESRLATKKEVHRRYIDLLRNKTANLSEVLHAEEQIRTLQEEVEAKEGRLAYLRDQVTVSRIYLTLYEPVLEKATPQAYRTSVSKKFWEQLTNGWQIILNIFLFLAGIWPIVLLGLGLFLFRKKWLHSLRS